MLYPAININVYAVHLTRYTRCCVLHGAISQRPFGLNDIRLWSPQTHLTSLMMTSSSGNIFRVTGHLCGEFTGPGDFPTQRPVTRSFDVFFDLRLNKRLSKQSWGWWFDTQSLPLWRQCNGIDTPFQTDVYTSWFAWILTLLGARAVAFKVIADV